MPCECAPCAGQYPTVGDWENHLTTIFPEVRAENLFLRYWLCCRCGRQARGCSVTEYCSTHVCVVHCSLTHALQASFKLCWCSAPQAGEPISLMSTFQQRKLLTSRNTSLKVVSTEHHHMGTPPAGCTVCHAHGLLACAYPPHALGAPHWPCSCMQVRLKRFLEMRGADGGPWRMLCALPALWVGLLYDSQV